MDMALEDASDVQLAGVTTPDYATSLDHRPEMDQVTGRSHAETLLLKAARAYGLQVRREHVQSAMHDPVHGAAFAEWALNHLILDCLLSADELAL